MSLLTVLDLRWAAKCRRIVFFRIHSYVRPTTKWILTSHSVRPKCQYDEFSAGWGRTKICPKIIVLPARATFASATKFAHTFAGWFMACLCSTDLATSKRKQQHNWAASWAPRKSGPWIRKKNKKIQSQYFAMTTLRYLPQNILIWPRKVYIWNL